MSLDSRYSTKLVFPLLTTDFLKIFIIRQKVDCLYQTKHVNSYSLFHLSRLVISHPLSVSFIHQICGPSRSNREKRSNHSLTGFLLDKALFIRVHTWLNETIYFRIILKKYSIRARMMYASLEESRKMKQGNSCANE